jgi:hypothetical protein
MAADDGKEQSSKVVVAPPANYHLAQQHCTQRSLLIDVLLVFTVQFKFPAHIFGKAS